MSRPRPRHTPAPTRSQPSAKRATLPNGSGRAPGRGDDVWLESEQSPLFGPHHTWPSSMSVMPRPIRSQLTRRRREVPFIRRVAGPRRGASTAWTQRTTTRTATPPISAPPPRPPTDARLSRDHRRRRVPLLLKTYTCTSILISKRPVPRHEFFSPFRSSSERRTILGGSHPPNCPPPTLIS